MDHENESAEQVMAGVPPYIDLTSGLIGLLQPADGSVFSGYMACYNSFRFGMGYNGVDWKEIDGLDIEGLRIGNSGRPRDTGEFIGFDLLAGRDIIFKGDCAAGGTPNPGATVQQNLSIVGSVFSPQGTTETTLYINVPGMAGVYLGSYAGDGSLVHGAPTTGPDTGLLTVMDPPILQVMGRPGNRAWKIDLAMSKGYLAQDIQLLVHCTDPRLYQYPTQTQYFATDDNQTITNNGNWDCRPIVYLMSPPASGTSPVLDPSLKMGDNTMIWNGTITNNGYLLADMYNQTVTQFAGPGSACPNAACSTAYAGGGTTLESLNGSASLSATADFVGFAGSGKAVVQTSTGLATISYSGLSGDTMTGVQYLTGAIGVSGTTKLEAYGMILQDAAGGISLPQTPYQGSLQPNSDWGVLMPGDTVVSSSTCVGYINWASAWIL